MILPTRPAMPEDRPCLLAAIMSTASPLQPAHVVDTPFAYLNAYPYLLVGKGEMLAGAIPVALVPHLALGDSMAWLPVGVMVFSGDPAARGATLAAVNEYTRAHGVLHVLLPPVALPAEDAAALGFAPDTSGC